MKRSRLLGPGGLLGPSGLGQPRRRVWLINDAFTTARIVGAINNTYAEPGPGQRSVVDTLSKLSIASGQLDFAVGSAANDPQLRHLPAVARLPGRLCKAALTMTVVGAEIGWESNTSGSAADSVRFTTTVISVRINTSAVLAVGAAATGVVYQIAVVLRETGAFYFIQGGAFTNWTMLWIAGAGAYNPAYTVVTATGATGVFVTDYLRVPSARWLPAPLLSHGFSVLTPSDGLGHAEGVAGGLGSGGSGVTLTSILGTWGVSGGAAQCSALAVGIGQIGATATADVVVTAKVTRAAGRAGVFVRYLVDNYVYAVHNGTNVVLVKRVSGVETTLIDTAATYVAGAEMRVICQGTAYRVFYNNVAIGSEQSIGDIATSNTIHGLYTENTTNTFDDLVIMARGTGGEYAALDAF